MTRQFLRKSTDDGVFTVDIHSDGFLPENENDEISGESLYQLVQLLEGLAMTIRLSVDPDLQRTTPLNDQPSTRKP